MIVVSMPNEERLTAWTARLAEHLPERVVRSRLDAFAPDDVRHAVVWKPPMGWLAMLPNLQAVTSIGAGVDHVLADPAYPAHVPLLKTMGPAMTQRMREYVALHVLRMHRDQPTLERAAAERRWAQAVVPPASGRRVGVMGLGTLGRAAAETLMGLGFPVSGWSCSGARIENMESFAGDELHAFAASCDILVNLLPLTPQTQGILCARLFDVLPRGACLLNAARGQHLVEDDLLAALADGRIAHATLDVFRTEPLPADHAFWTHPHVTVTPHVASLIDAETGAPIIAANIRAFERDGRVPDMADATRGY